MLRTREARKGTYTIRQQEDTVALFLSETLVCVPLYPVC